MTFVFSDSVLTMKVIISAVASLSLGLAFPCAAQVPIVQTIYTVW